MNITLLKVLAYLENAISRGVSGVDMNIEDVKNGRWVVGYFSSVVSGDIVPASVFVGKKVGTNKDTTVIGPCYLLATRKWGTIFLEENSIVTSYIFYRIAWIVALSYKKAYMRY